MNETYIKLSSLVGESFTIKELKPFVWKKWSTDEGKMLVSERYQEGFRKVYPCVTSKGLLDLSAAQVGSILEACVWGGVSEVVGKTIEVKSNGKTGMDIRYFFNAVKSGASGYEQAKAVASALKPKEEEDEVYPMEEEVDLSNIPF